MTDVLLYRAFVRKLLLSLRFRQSKEKAKVLSDKEFSRVLGISSSEFSRIQSGVVSLSSLSFFRLLCLCKQYNLSIDERLDCQLKIDFID